MNTISEKAFTLVELLIVIGIIGILAVTLLVNLNPAEAQKKTRDAARLKDAVTLQTIVEQMLSDGLAPTSWANDATMTGTTATGTVSATSSTSGTGPQPCAATNWLGVNVCNYAKTVPRDPLNGRTTPCAGGTTNCFFTYALELNGTAAAPGVDYEINVRQESTSNATKIAQDGGSDARMYEIFSGSNAIINSATN